MKRTSMLAMAFGVLAMGLATAQQQPPPGGGGTQPSFRWREMDTDVDGKNGFLSPCFWPENYNIATSKLRMGCVGETTYYPAVTCVSTEVRYRAGVNGTFPDLETALGGNVTLQRITYGQGQVATGKIWDLVQYGASGYVFDPGQQVSVCFRTGFDSSSGTVYYRQGLTTATAQSH